MYDCTFKGITNSHTEAVRKNKLLLDSDGKKSFLTQQEIDNGEMVCFVPNKLLGSWIDNQTECHKKVIPLLSLQQSWMM